MSLPEEVRKAINRRAYSLAQASAAHYRAALERHAAELLRYDPTTRVRVPTAEVVAAIDVAQVDGVPRSAG